jgi:type IV secretory pathway TraG/TraD family ATPase VirD4
METTADSTADDRDDLAASLSDPTRFGGLFDRHVRAVHRYLARRSSLDEADDLTAATFVAAFRGAALTEAAHWVERAQTLLGPLLHAAALADTGMDDICRWVLSHDVVEPESMLLASGAQMAKVVLTCVARTEERERSGIFSTASGILSAYRSEAVLAASRNPNFDPDEFVTMPNTLYICAPAAAQEQFAPIVVSLLERIRSAVFERHAKHPDAAPTLFALDEVANIAPLASLPQIASEGGGQGLLLLACLQDLSQARVRWGAAADGFFSLFTSKVVLPGIGDARTLQLVSELAGEVPITTRSVTRPRHSALTAVLSRSRPGSSTTVGTTWRRMLPPDEVALGKPGTAVLMRSGQAIGRVAIVPWWNVPKWREKVKGPASHSISD